MKNHNYYVYILKNNSGTLYIGVTNNLQLRIQQHKSGLIPGFTQKYKIHILIYYEYFTDISEAIRREKELKGWRREKKIELIIIKNLELKEIIIEDEKVRCGDPSSLRSSG